MQFLDHRRGEGAEERFRSAADPKDGFPVPIELVSGRRVGKKVVEAYDLLERIGVSGFRTNDPTPSFDDLFEILSHEPRYRPTLARVLGHGVPAMPSTGAGGAGRSTSPSSASRLRGPTSIAWRSRL